MASNPATQRHLLAGMFEDAADQFSDVMIEETVLHDAVLPCRRSPAGGQAGSASGN